MEWITMEKVGTYIHGCKLRKKEDLLKHILSLHHQQSAHP